MKLGVPLFAWLVLSFGAAAQAPPGPASTEIRQQWLLVWVVANVSAASLPEQQRFDTKAKCESAAQVLNELTAKTGLANANVPVSVRAGCVEVSVEASVERE